MVYYITLFESGCFENAQKSFGKVSGYKATTYHSYHSNLSELFFENFRELERNSALNLMPLCISHKPCIPQRYYVVVTLFHNFDARSLTHRWCNIVIPT